MKKLLSILLVLCLLCPAALADSGDVYVSESHIHTYMEGENQRLHAVFVLENRSKELLVPAAASVALLNAQGEVCYEDISPMFPPALQPGERGYVYGLVLLSPEMQKQYDHAELYLALTEYSKYEKEMLSEMAKQVLYPKATVTAAGSTATVQVTNTAGMDIHVGAILLLHRNQAGEIVGVTEDFIVNLPVGETMEKTYEFPFAAFDTVEICCYAMPM